MDIEAKIIANKPLSPLTTFRIGGPAKYFIEAETKEELLASIEWSAKNGEKIFYLGGGSNLLVNDKGVDGLVIKFNNRQSSITENIITCGSGFSLAALVSLASENSLSGLEWAIGIPGTVGGAVRGNAGAFGGSMDQSIMQVEAYDIGSGVFTRMSNPECSFEYRNSIFIKNGNYLIWEASLELERADSKLIIETARKHLAHRNKIQPHQPSAGSIFKNIIFEQLMESNPPLANEAVKENRVKGGKVAAAWLIDKLGLKGKKIGGAQISEEHANFIINTGNATADEVAMLISFIKQQIRDIYNVQLSEEVVYFGY